MATEKLIAMKTHVLVSGAEDWGQRGLLNPEEGEPGRFDDGAGEPDPSLPKKNEGCFDLGS